MFHFVLRDTMIGWRGCLILSFRDYTKRQKLTEGGRSESFFRIPIQLHDTSVTFSFFQHMSLGFHLCCARSQAELAASHSALVELQNLAKSKGQAPAFHGVQILCDSVTETQYNKHENRYF